MLLSHLIKTSATPRKLRGLCGLAAAVFLGLVSIARAQVGSGWTEYFPSKQYNGGVSQSLRYSISGTEEHFWIYATDPSAFPGQDSGPRSEWRVNNDYTTGTQQFQGDYQSENGTDAVTVFQIFGSTTQATSIQFQARDGNGDLKRYDTELLTTGTWGVYHRVNVIHDCAAGSIKVWINGSLVGTFADGGQVTHYFKYGVYSTTRFVTYDTYAGTYWRGVRYFQGGTSSGGTSTAGAPVFSPAGGTYNSAQTVSITSTTSGASIRYTTDGSTPTTTTGTLYSGPVAVNSSETLNAIAYASGYNNSAVSSATYAINILPTGWSDADVGAPTMAGSATYNSGTFTVTGGGSDIWGTADQFNYVYQATSGDATVTANVATQPATNAWTKSGVMFRGSTAANDMFVDVFVTPSNGIAMQYRSAVGGTCTSITGTAGVVAPYWVRIVRSGTTFTGYSSADGATWTQVGSVSLPMATSATAGLEVCAHTTTATNTSTFQSVSISSSTPSTFTITASAGTGGTISPSGSVSVAQGANQTFTIAANSGYAISSVTVDGVNQGALSSYTFGNVQANHTIAAAFSAVTSSNVAPNGTAYGWSANTSSTANTNRAAQPGLNDNNLTANVDLDSAGDAIGAWEGAGVVWSSAQTISSAKFINGDITTGGDGFLTANCTLQYSTDGSTWTNTGWTITPSYPNSSSAGGQTYSASGTALSGVLGMRFVGQVRTTDTSYHWIVKEVQFIGSGGSTPTNYTITASAGTGGSISPSGSVSVAQGANQTFTIAASSGYAISSVTVDGVNQGALSSYTFSNVQANHTISAAFSAVPSTFTITASAGTGGTISPSGTVSVTQGASQTFTIAASSGYTISSVTVDGVNQGALSSYTFSNVQANHTIAAAFSAVTNSNIAPSGTAYGWNANTSSTANTNRAAQPGLNDNNLTNNVDLDSAGDAIGAWEGAGVVWSSAVNITSAKFINGDITTGGDGFLTANCTLQYSTDGSTWVNTGWTISPSYPNSSSAGGQTYSASGTALSGVLGMRFVGQVRTTDTSYHWIVKEVQFIGNGGSSGGTVATPTFSPAGGSYSSAQSVSIATTTAGASIRYTTDGSTPSETAGTLYSGPVTVSATATLNAIAYESGMTDSGIASATYTIGSGTTNYTPAQILSGVQARMTSSNQVNTLQHINTMTRAMNVNVYQVSTGVFAYTSSMAIDTDGSDPDPDPDHQSTTTWTDSTGAYLGAHHVPYYVLGDDCYDKTSPCPHFYYVEHNITGLQFALIFYNGNCIGAVFGDTQATDTTSTSTNDSRELGEASVEAANLLGIPSSGTTGGVNDGVTVVIFSGSQWVVTGTNTTLEANAQALVQKALNQLGTAWGM